MQKKVSLAIYCVLLLLCIFSLGYLIGVNHTSADVRVVTAEPSTIQRKETLQEVEEIPETQEIVNINTAARSVLETLPGIGPELAERIIVYRQENNGFAAVEQIMNVQGIGQKRYETLKDLITVGGAP